MIMCCLYTICATAQPYCEPAFKCLPHPIYSPDLAPYDYHVFGHLKEALGGKKFSTDDEKRC